MRRLLEITLACSAVFGGGAACAQGTVGNGTFQDLNFGQAILVYYPDNPSIWIEAGPALPGWTATIGGSDQNLILYNVYNGSGACISLFGTPISPSGENYDLTLQGGAAGTSAIQQTGVIPLGANSIRFYSQNSSLNYPPLNISAGLTVNGQPVTLDPISVQNNVWLYAGNIAQYAGKTVTIDFYASAPTGLGSLNLQDISFSSQGVPEPETLALAGLGGLALLSIARKRPR
jgi:hypothetical protein